MNKQIFKKSVLIGIVLLILCALPVSTFAGETEDDKYRNIGQQLAEDVEKYHIPAMAVAVVDKDGVLYEQTFGECKSVDQPFIIGSMSKSFTAAAIMQLCEQGRIDLDDPIDKYMDVSEWFSGNTDYGRITVRDLLNQTSGITTFQRFGSLTSTDAYGTHVYANANYGLLGLLIEVVSGQTYEEYVEQNLFEPLGMVHSAASLEKSRENGLIRGYRNYFGIPVAGEPDFPKAIHKGSWTNVPAGYLTASVSDMEKYLRMYLRNGENILSPESIEQMFYSNVPAGEGTYYGMGWNYETGMLSTPVITHAGLVENYTSNMFILPDRGIAIVVLVNMNDYLVGNNLLGNIVMPLFGEPKQDGPNMYFLMHLAIDVVCLLLFFISVYPLITLKKWRTKAEQKRLPVADILRHLILPAVLMLIPLFTGTPYRVLWLFVKDLAIVIAVNAALLLGVGIYKAICLLNRKRTQ